jgi:type IV secretory pathway VirB2 component (pilin)
MTPNTIVWLVAALLMVAAPYALLFGAEPWRVAAVVILEMAMVFWTARWVNKR